MNKSYDIIIAGGGVMGSSLAFWLSRLASKGLRVLVVERDKTYAQSATALSVASIRLQFSNPINVKISRFGLDFIRNIKSYLGEEAEIADLGFQENGYLFLSGTDAQVNAMQEVVKIQYKEGASTEILQPQEINQRWSMLNVEDVLMGSFGPKDEGWFDNMGLLWGLRRAARAGGVDYIDDEVVKLHRDGDKITSVELAQNGHFSCGHVVNACGTRAAKLMHELQEVFPVEPRKRTVFVIDAPNAQSHLLKAPLLVDYTGFYLRPEGQNWIVATVPDQDGPCNTDDFDPDYTEFDDIIWPRLYHRAPAFDAVKVIRAWAGQYDYNRLDQNAVVGLWPGFNNLYIMNGFSGHGLQQAPALGRGMAELLLHGHYKTLDLSNLHPERLLDIKPFMERAVV